MNENWLGLDGQVVIVTGGASGIGKHVVDTLVKVGANAVAVDLNVKTGDELDGAYCVQCNVTDPESVNQMVQAVLEKYGKGLVYLALAESCLEKGKDIFEIFSKAEKGRMDAERGGYAGTGFCRNRNPCMAVCFEK